jgi:hypothetical protein
LVEVFAGFVVGYALAVALTPVAAIALARASDGASFARRVAPPGTSIIALSVALHFAGMLALTAIGLVLGMALGGIDDRRPAGGIGSPNIVYTLLIVALTAVIFIPALVLPALRRYVLAAAALFAASFGWALPWLANLG